MTQRCSKLIHSNTQTYLFNLLLRRGNNTSRPKTVKSTSLANNTSTSDAAMIISFPKRKHTHKQRCSSNQLPSSCPSHGDVGPLHQRHLHCLSFQEQRFRVRTGCSADVNGSFSPTVAGDSALEHHGLWVLFALWIFVMDHLPEANEFTNARLFPRGKSWLINPRTFAAFTLNCCSFTLSRHCPWRHCKKTTIAESQAIRQRSLW